MKKNLQKVNLQDYLDHNAKVMKQLFDILFQSFHNLYLLSFIVYLHEIPIIPKYCNELSNNKISDKNKAPSSLIGVQPCYYCNNYLF